MDRTMDRPAHRTGTRDGTEVPGAHAVTGSLGPGAWLDRARPRGRARAVGFEILAVLVGSLVVAVCAQVALRIPGVPWVPITLQTFGVLVVASALGARRGTAALLLYLAEGAAGGPVFAGLSFGLAHFAGPTGGYLVAFVPAAWIAGTLADRGWDRSFARSVASMTLATAVIFAGGLAWLAILTGLPPAPLLAAGFWPFLPGAVVKIIAAAAILPRGAALRHRG